MLAMGTAPLAYQWYKNSFVTTFDTLKSNAFLISSAIDSTYATALSNTDNWSTFFCKVIDPCGDTVISNSATVHLACANILIATQPIDQKSTPALHKNVMQLREESSSFCQIFDNRGKNLCDFGSALTVRGEHTTGLNEPSGAVDDISSDRTDVLEGPELDSFEGRVSFFVGSGHLKLAA